MSGAVAWQVAGCKHKASFNSLKQARTLGLEMG